MELKLLKLIKEHTEDTIKCQVRVGNTFGKITVRIYLEEKVSYRTKKRLEKELKILFLPMGVAMQVLWWKVARDTTFDNSFKWLHKKANAGR